MRVPEFDAWVEREGKVRVVRQGINPWCDRLKSKLV
jgi:hypothetical protein